MSQPKQARSHWLVQLAKLRWLRLAILGGVCAFEIYLTYLLKSQGWVATVEPGSQILIVAAAVSPLIIAFLILSNGRFRIVGLLTVIGLIAVFLGFVVLPVLEERGASVASQQLHGWKIDVSDESYSMVDKNPKTHGRIIRAPKQKRNDLLQKLAFTDNDLLRDSEIAQVSFHTQDDVLKGCFLLPKLKNLHRVDISGDYDNEALQLLLSSFQQSSAQSLMALPNSPSPLPLQFTIQALDGNEKLNQLCLSDYPNLINDFESIELPNLKYLAIANVSEAFDWDRMLKTKIANSIESFGIGASVLDNSDAKLLVELSQLKELYLHRCAGLTDVDFLSDMTNLEQISLVSDCKYDSLFDKLGSHSKLKLLYVSGLQGVGIGPTVPANVSDESIEKLKKELPDCAITVFK